MFLNGVIFSIEIVCAFALLMIAGGIRFETPSAKKNIQGKVIDIKGKKYICEPMEKKAA